MSIEIVNFHFYFPCDILDHVFYKIGGEKYYCFYDLMRLLNISEIELSSSIIDETQLFILQKSGGDKNLKEYKFVFEVSEKDELLKILVEFWRENTIISIEHVKNLYIQRFLFYFRIIGEDKKSGNYICEVINNKKYVTSPVANTINIQNYLCDKKEDVSTLFNLFGFSSNINSSVELLIRYMDESIKTTLSPNSDDKNRYNLDGLQDKVGKEVFSIIDSIIDSFIYEECVNRGVPIDEKLRVPKGVASELIEIYYGEFRCSEKYKNLGGEELHKLGISLSSYAISLVQMIKDKRIIKVM